MYLVGLTGGIGSGKSTVARRLAELGCEVIEADQLAREVVEPGEPALDALVERFGRRILRGDGRLDRGELAAIAFADEAARADLDAITHPRIMALVERRIAELASDPAAGGRPRIVVVDHPLLVETGQQERFDALVVVVAPEELRVRRLVDRGMEEHDARARIGAQTDDEARRAVATHVIPNDGDLAALVGRIDELHARLATEAATADRH